jgi:hypothetical protein
MKTKNTKRTIGTLFPNQFRNKEKSPALTGTLNILPKTFEELLLQQRRNPYEPVVAKLAAWKHNGTSGSYLVVELQSDLQKQRRYQEPDDDQEFLDFVQQ